MLNIDRMINDKLDEAERWKAIAERTTGNLNDIRVQTTKKPDKMASAVVMAADLEEEASNEAKRLMLLKKTIIKQIDRLGEDGNSISYDILKKYYVQGKDFGRIAKEVHYSYRQMKRLYEKSIRDFEEMNGKEYLNP